VQARLATAAATVRRDLAPESLTFVQRVNCIERGGKCHYVHLATDELGSSDGSIAVGGPQLLRTIAGRRASQAESALRAGKVVAFSSGLPEFLTFPDLRAPHVDVASMSLGHDGASFSGIMSRATADRHGFGIRAMSDADLLAVMPDGEPPAVSLVDRVNDELTGDAYLVAGRPYTPGGYSIGLVVLAAMAGLVMIAATAVSVGLSMAESKPDLVTLSAIGSRPRTRRLLVSSQAGTVAILGATLGVVAGLVPAWAILRANHAIPFVMPWTTIGVLLVGIPALAMVGTAMFAGSRVTLDRRLT
jgi:putative ABC transport system permease protein